MVTTTEIAASVRGVGHRLQQLFANQGWSVTNQLGSPWGVPYPQVNAEEFLSISEAIAIRIESLRKIDIADEEVSRNLSRAGVIADRIQFSNVDANILSAAVASLSAIDALVPIPKPSEPKVNWEEIKGTDLVPRDLKARLRKIEGTIRDLEPRSSSLAPKLKEIEDAHDAATNLDVVMADLTEGQQRLNEMNKAVEAIYADLTRKRDAAEAHSDHIRMVIADAEAANKKAAATLSAATSAGLAASFDDRRKSLSKAGAAWIVGLAIALVVGLLVGYLRIEAMKDVLTADKSASAIWVNGLLTVLGVGAPIWFATVATRQAGVSFRLAEDYAFKAAVSRAYEGYRAEAVNIDPALAGRLFGSALDRLDEPPIRLLDSKADDSPLAEFLNNPLLRKQLEGVPDLGPKLLALISSKAAVLVPAAGAVAVATSSGVEGGEEEK